MGYHCYRNQIAITVVLLLQLLRLCTFVPILSSYNFRRHTPALPIPDWEEILREATYLALAHEQNVPASIRHYLYSAPLIGRQDTATPFGDIAILARGQLYSAPGGFQFVQDPYQNDCDGCHNTEPECHGENCAVWRSHGHERLLALWSIKRIRHRDPNYGHRYELEYTISPMTNPIKSRFFTRNGRFDYSIPGYKFVAVLGSGPSGYTLLPANKYVNKVYRQTDPFNRDNWIPSYPPLDRNTYLPPKSTVKPPLIQLVPPNKPNLDYLPPHKDLLPPVEVYDKNKVYKDLLKALESQGTALGRTTTKKPTPPHRHSSTITPNEIFDVIPQTKPAATLATTATTTTTQETTKPVSVEPATHITTRGIPPMLTTITIPKQTIPAVNYATTPTETTSPSPTTTFTYQTPFPSHTTSSATTTTTTPINPEITSTPGKVTEIPTKRTTKRYRPVTRPTTDFDVFGKETGPGRGTTSAKIMRVSSTKSYDTDIFGESLQTEPRNVFKATSRAVTTTQMPYEATTTSYITTDVGTYIASTGLTTERNIQLSTQPEISLRNAQPTESTMLPTTMEAISDNVKTSVPTEPVKTDTNVMTTVVETSTPSQTAAYSPTSTVSTTASSSPTFSAVSSVKSFVSSIPSAITTTIPPTTTLPFTMSSSVTVLTTSYNTFSPPSSYVPSSTAFTPSIMHSTVVPEITRESQVTETTKPIFSTTIPTILSSQTTRRFKPLFPRTSTTNDFPVITPTVPIKLKTTRVFPRRKTTPFTSTSKAYVSNHSSEVTTPIKTSTTTGSISILSPSTTLAPTISTFQTPTQYTAAIHTTNTQEAPTSFKVSSNGETLMIVTPMPMATSTTIAESQTKEETTAPIKSSSKVPSIQQTVMRNRIKPNNNEFDDIFGSAANSQTAPKKLDKTKIANSRLDVDDIFGGAKEPKTYMNKRVPQRKLNPVLSTRTPEKSSSTSTTPQPTIVTKETNAYKPETPTLNQNRDKIIFSNFFTPSTNDYQKITTEFQPSTSQPTEISTSQSFSTSISFETSKPENPTVSPISIDIESTVMAHVKEIHVNDTGYKIYAAEYPCVIEARTDNSPVLNNDQDLEKYTLSLANSARSIDYLSKNKAVKKLKRRSERNRKRHRRIQQISV